MATLAQISDLSSPVPSSLSMARGGCQWRSKNKVCILQCYPPTLLQPVQEVHEMDKLPLLTVIFIYFFFGSVTFLVFPTNLFKFFVPTISYEGDLQMHGLLCSGVHAIALFCVWLLSVALFCISQLLPQQRQGNTLEALHMPLLIWQTIIVYFSCL